MGRPALADIEAARARLDGISRVTPVYPSNTLERLSGRVVHLKAENLQLTGAFKIRAPTTRSPSSPATSSRRES